MIVQGSRIDRDMTYRADVIVVGSGAGGAVVARELAEQGMKVLVLEEGPYVSPEVYGRWRPMQSFRRMARSAGTTLAIGTGGSPSISILAGSCVGGSSVLTGGVCFRIPDEVHAEWVDLLGTDSLSEAAMRPLYERVEAMVGVEEVPEHMRSRGTQLFGEGAAKVGYNLHPTRRNTSGCCGCSRCNFGCPQKAKLSVDLTYLPRAVSLGTTICADHRVRRVLFDGDRAVGVEGVLLADPDRTEHHRFVAKADTVVLAAGTMYTPSILRRSGYRDRSGQLGRNVTLHPACRGVGVYDEPVQNWKGAMQSAYADHFTDRRLMFVSVSAPVSVLAAGQPGVGPEYMQRVRASDHISTFGFMVHDDPRGRVRSGIGHEPVMTYNMSKADREAMREGMRLMCETMFASGAREVLLPAFGAEPLGDMDQARKAIAELDLRTLESLAFHPLGSCRMGRDEQTAVCDIHGRVFGVRNLWLADGSILPTSVGVNTQIPIMTMATRTAFEIVESTLHSATGSHATV